MNDKEYCVRAIKTYKKGGGNRSDRKFIEIIKMRTEKKKKIFMALKTHSISSCCNISASSPLLFNDDRELRKVSIKIRLFLTCFKEFPGERRGV